MTEPTQDAMDIPPAWNQISLADLRGVALIVGAPDVGKSTLARYLYRRLSARGEPAAFLDGDPGQSTLGPPATITLALSRPGDEAFPPRGRSWRRFIGAVSPRGHMLPLLVGAARLVEVAREAGAGGVIYDTTGLIDPAQGGVNLKLAKIDLLRPAVLIAIQRGDELEPLLKPLRRSRRVRVIELRPSEAAARREIPLRQQHRAELFQKYFAGARPLNLDLRRLAVLPRPDFALDQLVALEDAAGFVLGLGIVERVDVRAGTLTLRTPLASPAGVDALHLGDLTLDPRSYRDRRLR